MKTTKLKAHSESLKAATVEKVERAMKEIQGELSEPENSLRQITLRSICARAGITEQTLHKKDHKALKQKVLDWRDNHFPKRHRLSTGSKVLPSVNSQSTSVAIKELAAEVMVLRKSLLDLQEENKRLKDTLRRHS